MIYRDRTEAAALLADALASYRGTRPLVVAIPRGSVPMGRLIADRLDGDLDVVLIRKLGAPGNPEFAVGAVDETGWTYLADYATAAGATREYLDREIDAALTTIRERRARYTPARAPLDAADRVVIVVDDGLATGATMIAALHAMRSRAPRRLICATPVASVEALAHVREHADEVVCLQSPAYFHAVGQFYSRFPQLSDDEVVALLAIPPRDDQQRPDSSARTNSAS